ncbi:MAG: GNAT family N-acetyltransferase [Desulfobacteraceae bacterium]|nr:MAG: GNAT family N-acetyltransferase [Desulfobacteraceae bacterium]
MLRIELLTKRHDRKGFDCGEPALNNYLKKTARQHIEKGISRTFILVDTEEPTSILGFFTLASCEVVTSGLPGKSGRIYPAKAQAAKLARLAVSTHQQRRGLGSIMMVEAMQRTLAVAENIGIIGFFVNAKNQDARKYYEQFGFIALPNNPLELFLPLNSLKAAIEAADK